MSVPVWHKAWHLKQPHPLEFHEATPNAYQKIALCQCVFVITWHPARHKPPSIWGRHWAGKTGISPGTKTLQIQSCTKHALWNNPTLLEFNLATPNAHQVIALCLCNSMTVRLMEASSPQKTLAGSTGNGLLLPSCMSCGPLIAVNSGKLFGAHG